MAHACAAGIADEWDKRKKLGEVHASCGTKGRKRRPVFRFDPSSSIVSFAESVYIRTPIYPSSQVQDLLPIAWQSSLPRALSSPSCSSLLRPSRLVQVCTEPRLCEYLEMKFLSRWISRSQMDIGSSHVHPEYSVIPVPSEAITYHTNPANTPRRKIHYPLRLPLLTPYESSQGTVGGAVECAEYLKSLGKRECRAEKGGTVMCTARRTVVMDHCPACSGDECAISGMWMALMDEG